MRSILLEDLVQSADCEASGELPFRSLSSVRVGAGAASLGLNVWPGILRSHYLRRWGIGPDEVGSHHLVVLVFNDVAVPDIQPRKIKQGFDARDLFRVGDDGVLEAGLPAFRRSGGAASNGCRLTSWNWTSWMWIGWASSVKLCISQISMEFKAGFSVIGSSQPIGTGFPEPSSVPSRAATGPSKPGNVLASSLSDTCRVRARRPQRLERGQRRAGRDHGWCLRSSGGTTTNCITWPVVPGSAEENRFPARRLRRARPGPR